MMAATATRHTAGPETASLTAGHATASLTAGPTFRSSQSNEFAGAALALLVIAPDARRVGTVEVKPIDVAHRHRTAIDFLVRKN